MKSATSKYNAVVISHFKHYMVKIRHETANIWEYIMWILPILRVCKKTERVLSKWHFCLATEHCTIATPNHQWHFFGVLIFYYTEWPTTVTNEPESGSDVYSRKMTETVKSYFVHFIISLLLYRSREQKNVRSGLVSFLLFITQTLCAYVCNVSDQQLLFS